MTTQLPEGLRIADETEAGWTYRTPAGTLWVTDEAAKEEAAPTPTETFTPTEQAQIDDMVIRINAGEMSRDLFIQTTERLTTNYRWDMTEKREHELAARRIVEERTRPAIPAAPVPPPTPAVTEEGEAAAQPTYLKEIVYDRESRDYALYLDKELVGFARTYHEAEVTLDQLVLELLQSGITRTATELDGGDPEHVALVEPEPAPPVDDGPADNFGGFRQPITMDRVVEWAYAMRHVPLADEERWAHRTQPACSCGSTCPCCDPSHPEAPERGWERAEIDIPSVPACEQCCAGPATWEVREKSGLCHICDTCYRNEFEENPDRHWTAWEADRLSTPIDPPPPTRIIRAECAICHDRAGCKEREEQRYCRNCRGLHHIQQCPEIGMLLMPGPLPAQTCPSCGDPSQGLCAACREVGEMRTKLRETVQSLPALTKETLKVYRDGPSWAL